ncbi:MAG: DUF1343 domain-containing protein [Opitutaceae bacterium]|nr:DUF1343 domain-containing protein [Opitutaceae bacterium]
MAGVPPALPFVRFFPLLIPLLGLFGCSASQPPAKAPFQPPIVTTAPEPEKPVPGMKSVMLGIDVLEADGFATLKGKRLGLLTHPAGVNRHGVSTIEVLRRAPGVKLVALFGVEHGINNEFPAGKNYNSYTDPKTGLPVNSLYDGKSRKPTKAQLAGLDALVVDLQDIGTRSYTFISAMKLAAEAAFENGKELIILDRPNPLGGLKVDGPLLDPHLALNNYVGAFRVPYVHGLTMGELARLARETPGVLSISDTARVQGKLTVVPMRGWTRAMRWTETGLTWMPTSPRIREFSAVMGYPMTGLGCEAPSGFRHGVGDQYPFRGLSHLSAKIDVYERELRALKLPGLQFRRVSVPNARTGQPSIGLFIEVADWEEWRPAELNFWLLKLTCKLEGKNPFTSSKVNDRAIFVKLLGSSAFAADLVAKGEKIDVEAWLRTWRAQAKAWQDQNKRFWLYR